ncbi:MAG: hypothetical protein IPG39_15330 [Bacteroidetes bacterium]|nr:hypothetical protein [Bacteroidota bacterium]
MEVNLASTPLMVAMYCLSRYLINPVSSRVKETAAIPGIFCMAVISIRKVQKVFPLTALIFISGSNELYNDTTSPLKPLNTESTMISPIEPTITPITEIIEIIFITLCDFLAKRYLPCYKDFRSHDPLFRGFNN